MGTADSAESRREMIVAMVNERGYMTLEDLCSILAVSQATMRTDLEALNADKRVIRLRGVVLSNRYTENEMGLQPGNNRALLLSNAMQEEKRKIAQAANRLFEKNNTIFLDTSNTNYIIAEEIVKQRDRRLTVVTNSLDILNLLSYGDHIDAVLTGGDYEAGTNSVVGNLAARFLSNFRAHYALVTARGFEPDGVRVYHSRNTSIRQAMLSYAERRVIVADHSKFDSLGVEVLCAWSEVDMLITDRRPPRAYADLLDEKGIQLILPQEGQADAVCEEGEWQQGATVPCR